MIDHWEPKYIVEKLRKKNTEESNRMADKLENMEHFDEYSIFNWELKINSMLDTFSKHF